MSQIRSTRTKHSLLTCTGGQTTGLPALGHAVGVGGSDHEDGDVSQGHQKVLPGAGLAVGAAPSGLAGGAGENNQPSQKAW